MASVSHRSSGSCCPHPRRRAGERGFTLMELVVVVALIGILAVIAIPNLLRAKVRAEMMAQVKTAQQAFVVCRIKAIRGGVPVCMVLQPFGGGRGLAAWVDENANETRDGGEPWLGKWIIPDKFDIFADASLQWYDLGSRIGGTGPPGALFLPSGSAIVADGTTSPTGQAAIILRDNRGNQMRLRVLSGTGTVVQEMRDPATGDWDAHSTRYWRY